jgi:hypothetical protein
MKATLADATTLSDALEANTCNWQSGVCLTRATLKRAVIDLTRIKNHSEALSVAYMRAGRALANHHCTIEGNAARGWGRVGDSSDGPPVPPNTGPDDPSPAMREEEPPVPHEPEESPVTGIVTEPVGERLGRPEREPSTQVATTADPPAGATVREPVGPAAERDRSQGVTEQESTPAGFPITPEDLERVVNEYGLLYHRALTSTDMVAERDACRRQLMAMVERYRAEGRLRYLKDNETRPTVGKR